MNMLVALLIHGQMAVWQQRTSLSPCKKACCATSRRFLPIWNGFSLKRWLQHVYFTTTRENMRRKKFAKTRKGLLFLAYLFRSSVVLSAAIPASHHPATLATWLSVSVAVAQDMINSLLGVSAFTVGTVREGLTAALPLWDVPHLSWGCSQRSAAASAAGPSGSVIRWLTVCSGFIPRKVFIHLHYGMHCGSADMSLSAQQRRCLV